MLFAGLLFGFCVFLALNYLGENYLEEHIFKDRIKRLAHGEIKISAPKNEILKTISSKKGPLSRLFEFKVWPSAKQMAIASSVMLGISSLILTKTPFPLATKFIWIFMILVVVLQFLKSAARKGRIEKIRKELPGTLELIVICLQAGMSINSAFLRVSNEMEDSVLGGELKQTFNEINAGIPLEDALKNFAKRSEVGELSSITSAIIQSQKMGTAVATTFKIQADSLREQYTMKAKEEIMKIPIKILFPLILFIFPSLFIVILGPAVVSMAHQFGR